MRLTKKGDNLYYTNAKFSSGAVFLDNNGSYTNACIDKLGQLEDIEDELGIELLTLFKALKDGIYIKRQTQYTYPLALLRTHFTNGKTRYYVYNSGKEKEIKLKDYGKTWALTREELL